jgi:uncharacterized membrane protein YcaP (DUF421 family)
MDNIFFDNWQSLARTFIITILAYLMMVYLLRASGKRTLSKMNAFDFIVTIALGSSLATVALNKNVALADGLLVFFLLIFLQYGITWLSVRRKKIKKIITSEPTLLLYKGEIMNDVLIEQRITMEEVYVAAREKGYSDLNDIGAMVLETTGEITVVKKINDSTPSTIQDVENYPR